ADDAVDAVADLGARQDEGDVEQPGDRLEPLQALLSRELAERIGRRVTEVEMKPAKRRHARLRYFPPLLIYDFPARLRRRETGAGSTAGMRLAESVVVCHGDQMGNASSQRKLRHLPRAAVG